MRMLLIGLAIAVVLPLGACGKKGEPKPPPSAEAAQVTDEDAKKKKQ